jgi:hypothetical protein
MHRTFVRVAHKMFLEHTVGVRFAEFKSEGSQSLPCAKRKAGGKREAPSKAVLFRIWGNTFLKKWAK